MQNATVSESDVTQVKQLAKSLASGLRHEGRPYNIISLAKAGFDNPIFFAAFVVFLVQKEGFYGTLIDSQLFHYFFAHHYSTLLDESSGDQGELSVFEKTFLLLEKIAESRPALSHLLKSLGKTFCGIRGVLLNQKREDQFFSLSLLNKEMITNAPIEPYFFGTSHLPVFSYDVKSASALYDFFGLAFILKLSLSSERDFEVFLNLKAQHSQAILKEFCKKLCRHELSVIEAVAFIPHLSDLISRVKKDIFWNEYVEKNTLFLLVLLHHPAFTEGMPPGFVKHRLMACINNKSFYAQPFQLAQLILKSREFSGNYDEDFILHAKNAFFAQCFSAEETDYYWAIRSFQLLEGRNFCRNMLRESEAEIMSAIEQGKTFLEIKALKALTTKNFFLIERIYPSIVFEFPFMNDDHDFSFELFYIQTRWDKRALALPFNFAVLLNECAEDSFGLANDGKKGRILSALLKKTTSAEIIKVIFQYTLEQRYRFTQIFLRIICLKEALQAEDIKDFFELVPLVPLPSNGRMASPRLMGNSAIYTDTHIFLAVKWIVASIPSYSQESIKNIFSFLFDYRNSCYPVPARIRLLTNMMNEEIPSDLERGLKNLLRQIHNGRIDFSMLLCRATRAREEQHDFSRAM